MPKYAVTVRYLEAIETHRDDAIAHVDGLSKNMALDVARILMDKLGPLEGWQPHTYKQQMSTAAFFSAADDGEYPKDSFIVVVTPDPGVLLCEWLPKI